LRQWRLEDLREVSVTKRGELVENHADELKYKVVIHTTDDV
jgi:hypothetical protein